MNRLYAKAREGFLTGTLAWSGANFKAALINTGVGGYDTPDFDNATDFSVELAGVVGTAVSIAVGTDGAGTAMVTGGSTEFTGVTGDEVNAVVIYEDNSGSGQPVVYIDEGFTPILPNGGNITVLWNSGSGEVFKL